MANQHHPDFKVRFWSKVNKSAGCWLFTSSLNRLGYGTICYGGKVQKAHRVSWQIHFGEIPENQCVLHKCDVRNCVNPAHLFLGTQQENIADMVQKGRNFSPGLNGMKNPGSKLSDDKVKAIRALYAEQTLSQHKLATMFKVSPMTINRVVNEKLWRQVQ